MGDSGSDSSVLNSDSEGACARSGAGVRGGSGLRGRGRARLSRTGLRGPKSPWAVLPGLG